MAGLTGSQVATRVKRQFGDEAGAQITDAIILDWINDAQNEIVAKNSELYQQKSTANTTVGTAAYGLPALATDIIRFKRVFYRGQIVDPISIEQAEEIYPEKDTLPRPTGAPRHYWIYAETLTFEPAPDATGALLTIYWQKYPTALTVIGDAVTLPQRYHLKVVDYCIAKAAELDDDDERHATKMAMFEAGISEMNADSWKPNDDVYPFPTVSSEDQFYG